MATTAIFLTFTAVAYFTTLTLTCAQPQQQRRSAVTVTEIEALTAFKLNLRDPLGFMDVWDPSTPSAPCDWRGVLCYNHRVLDLRLPRLQLGGELSNSLSKLTQLCKLSLHSNKLNSPSLCPSPNASSSMPFTSTTTPSPATSFRRSSTSQTSRSSTSPTTFSLASSPLLLLLCSTTK